MGRSVECRPRQSPRFGNSSKCSFDTLNYNVSLRELQSFEDPHTLHRNLSCKSLRKLSLMPVYEYICDECGSFNENRPITEYSEPYPCPSCGRLAKRNSICTPLILSKRSDARAILRAEAHSKRYGFAACQCCSGLSSSFSASPMTPSPESFSSDRRNWRARRKASRI